MKAVVVYWSQTGNTEEIANKISADLGCDAISVSNANVDDIKENDLIVLGCPAMGSEELEDYEFRPFFEELMPKVSNSKIALFGSYGWGDGEWMRNWEEEVKNNGLNLVTNGLIAMGGVSELDDNEYNGFISALK